LAGVGEIAGRAMGVAEVGEDVGFEVVMVEISDQVERTPVADDGLGMVAEVVVSIAKAVQGVVPADGVERVSLPASVTNVPIEIERPLGLVEGFDVTPLSLPSTTAPTSDQETPTTPKRRQETEKQDRR
jgi:hypothetical protein